SDRVRSRATPEETLPSTKCLGRPHEAGRPVSGEVERLRGTSAGSIRVLERDSSRRHQKSCVLELARCPHEIREFRSAFSRLHIPSLKDRSPPLPFPCSSR